jgi:hypothetical protein
VYLLIEECNYKRVEIWNFCGYINCPQIK